MGDQTEWANFWDMYSEDVLRMFGVGPNHQEEIHLQNTISELAHILKEAGCPGIRLYPVDAFQYGESESFCFPRAGYNKPLALLCPETCGCKEQPRQHGCPTICDPCVDALSLPDRVLEEGFSSCLDIKRHGFCEQLG